MSIYLLLLFVILICIPLENQVYRSKKLIIVLLIGLLFCLMVSLRAESVDRDYNTYLSNWKLIQKGIVVSIEPLNYLIASWSPTFLFYVIFYCVLGISLKLKAIWEMSPLPFLSILIYYSHFLFLHEMNQIRIGVACGFILLSIYYSLNFRKLRSYLCMLLAFLFHYSAIVGLLIYFLKPYKNNLKKYIIFFCVSLGVYILGLSILNLLSIGNLGFISYKVEQYNEVMSMGESANIHVFNIAFFIQILIGLLLVVLNNNFYINKYILLLTKMYWIGMSIYLLLTPIPVFAFRVSEIFMGGEFILIPSLLFLFKPKALSRLLICSFAIAFFILNIFILKLVNHYQSIL